MPRKLESVFERAQRTGYITGPEHMAARKRPAEKPEKPAASAKKPIEVRMSHDERRRIIGEAMGDKLKPKREKGGSPLPETAAGCWVKELTETHVVVERDGKTLAAPYSLDVAEGKAEIGEPFEVREERTYVPL